MSEKNKEKFLSEKELAERINTSVGYSNDSGVDEPIEEVQNDSVEEIPPKEEEIDDNTDENQQPTVKQTIENSANKAVAIGNKIKYPIQLVLSAIATPQFWIGVALVLLIWGGISFSYIFGPVTFGSVCNENGAPSIEKIEDGEIKSKAIAGYFSTDPNISKNSAAYLSKLIERENNDFRKSENLPDECNTQCLYEKMNNGELPTNLRLGPFRLSGSDVANLLTRAVNENKEWYDSSVQLATVKSIISNASLQEGSAIGDDVKIREAAVEINRLLNRNSIPSIVDQIVNESRELSQNVQGDITGCSSMGSGRGLGRISGGGASDGNMAGTIDSSSLIAFLESYNSSTQIQTPGNFGYGSATSQMLAAKQLAEQKGGIDPGGNIYSSCDRNVAIALKAMEIDTSFPWGAVVHQVAYMNSSPKWIKVSNCDRQSGDVITWGTGHIAIYGINQDGVEMVYQASFKEYLPHKSKAFGCGYQGDNRPIQYWRFVG